MNEVQHTSIKPTVIFFELRLELITECLKNLGSDRKAAQILPALLISPKFVNIIMAVA